MSNKVTQNKSFTLDELYSMTAHVFSEQSFGRSPESTFAHLVEVCGMLTALDRNKPRGEVDITDALCKALAWFFPLIAQLRVRSVSRLIFRKFPLVCPYCRQAPHDEMNCKNTTGLQTDHLDHPSLRELIRSNATRMPKTLNEWQGMFQAIYPRSSNDSRGRSSLGLMEELGELAEAIRVFDKYPHYFAGEAADVFSYIMGIANSHRINLIRHQDEFSFEDEFLKRYPGRCIQCGYPTCRCPRIPESTVGRMAKELPIQADENLFENSDIGRSDTGEISRRIFDRLGGFRGLIEKSVPMDRGQTTSALVEASLQLADRLKDAFPDYADGLRRDALNLVVETTHAGERKHSAVAANTVVNLCNALDELDRKSEHPGGAVLDFDRQLSDNLQPVPPKRVLFVGASPQDMDHLSIDDELRRVIQAIERRPGRLEVEYLPAATIDDVRLKLIENTYDVLHFSGHGSDDAIAMMDLNGEAKWWKFSSLKEYIEEYRISCVIINACNSVGISSLDVPTITMAEAIGDDEAIRYAEGFYDALVANRDYKSAHEEGCRAVDSLNLKISAEYTD